MPKLDAIIFDMDGTLADTEDIHRQSFNLAFKEFRIACNWNRSEYKSLLAVSGGRERIRQYLSKHNLASAKENEVAELAVEIHRRKSEIYRRKLVEGHISLRPGVYRLVHEAHDRGISLGIATSSSMKNVETLLRTSIGEASLKLFSSIVTCEVIGEQKPSPAIYQHVLAELKCKPENCIAIEDTRNGNNSALSAGIQTVITTHQFTTDNDFSGASLVIDSLGEPNHPFSVISGNAHGYQFVDVNLLTMVLTDSGEEPAWNTPGFLAAD